MKRPTWQLTWNDDMSVGIPEIDEDHKQFIVLINDLNRSMTEGMRPEEIKNKLQLVLDDTDRHFGHEEKLLRERLYPDADAHAKIHAQALKVLQTIKEKFIPYGLDSGWLNAGLMIKGILVDHILTEDMKYAEYYRNSKLPHKD
jgi:hemerythrin-like metal-binding protein